MALEVNQKFSSIGEWMHCLEEHEQATGQKFKIYRSTKVDKNLEQQGFSPLMKFKQVHYVCEHAFKMNIKRGIAQCPAYIKLSYTKDKAALRIQSIYLKHELHDTTRKTVRKSKTHKMMYVKPKFEAQFEEHRYAAICKKLEMDEFSEEYYQEEYLNEEPDEDILDEKLDYDVLGEEAQPEFSCDELKFDIVALKNKFRELIQFAQDQKNTIDTLGARVAALESTNVVKCQCTCSHSIHNSNSAAKEATTHSQSEKYFALLDLEDDYPSKDFEKGSATNKGLLRIKKFRKMPEVERIASEEPNAKKMKMETKCVLRWAKLTDKALEPVRGSKRAAGFDLRSAYDVTVPARGKAVVKTDLQVQVPEGSYGRVAPRSGLAVKNFIDVGAGVVDEDYRGNLGVVLFNHSDADFEVKVGDRIAQFICERIFYPELEFVEKLEDTERGKSGFGSTGINKMVAKNGTNKDAVEKNGADTTTEAVSENAATAL